MSCNNDAPSKRLSKKTCDRSGRAHVTCHTRPRGTSLLRRSADLPVAHPSIESNGSFLIASDVNSHPNPHGRRKKNGQNPPPYHLRHALYHTVSAHLFRRRNNPRLPSPSPHRRHPPPRRRPDRAGLQRRICRHNRYASSASRRTKAGDCRKP